MAAVAVCPLYNNYINFKFSTFEILLNLVNLSLVASNNAEIVCHYSYQKCPLTLHLILDFLLACQCCIIVLNHIVDPYISQVSQITVHK